MKTKHPERSLDAVLFRFHREIEKPTPAIVAAWSQEYPEYATEIQAHAVEILDIQLCAGTNTPDIASLEAKARSAGLNAVYEAKRRGMSANAGASLRKVVEQAGMPLRDLADRIGIARTIVNNVISGAIASETVNPKFLRKVAEQVGKDFETLRELIVLASHGGLRERMAFKAPMSPDNERTRAQTWQEAVLASDMSDEKKLYWLSAED